MNFRMTPCLLLAQLLVTVQVVGQTPQVKLLDGEESTGSAEKVSLALAKDWSGGLYPADCNGNLTPDDDEFLTGSEVLYVFDDGGANGFGSTVGGPEPGPARSLASHTVIAGGEYLTEISYRLGPFVSRGEKVYLFAYRDPNQDEHPADAELLVVQELQVAAPSSWTAATVSPPVYLGEAGTKFFLAVGFICNSARGVLSLDTNATFAGRSYWAHSNGLRWDSTGAGNHGEALMVRGKGRAAAGADCNRNGVLDDCDGGCAGPSVIAVNKAHANPTNRLVVYQVRFSEPVTGVDATDFSYTVTGTLATDAEITVTESAGGAVYTVEFVLAGGFGTASLNILDDGSIRNVGDVALMGSGHLGLSPYDVDARVAQPLSVTQTAPSITGPGTVGYEVEFDMPVRTQGTAVYPYHWKTSISGAGLTLEDTSAFGNALSLSQASSQHATIAPGDLFTGDFTIEAWIRPTSWAVNSTLADFSIDGTSADVSFNLGHGGYADLATPGLLLRNGGTVIGGAESPRRPPLGVWTHMAGVVEGTTIRLYQNGVLQAENTITGVRPTGTMSTNYLGRSIVGSPVYADTQVDELRVWNVARTREQIIASMFEPMSGGEPGLQLCLQFNEASGTLATDIGSEAMDATLVNGPTFVANTTIDRRVANISMDLTGDGFAGVILGNNWSTNFVDAPSPDYSTPLYQVDEAAPAVVGATRMDPSPTNADDVRWQVEFSEPIVAFDMADTLPDAPALVDPEVTSIEYHQGKAAAFNRVASQIRVPDVASSLGGGELTVEFWCRARGGESSSTFLLSPDNVSNRLLLHSVWTDNRIYWDHGNTGSGRISHLPSPVITGAWKHIAVSSSATNNRKRIFIDGALVAETAGVATVTPGDRTFIIGGDLTVGAGWSGTMRDFRIWARELDTAEVAANMSREIRSPESDLLLSYTFDAFEDLGTGASGTNDVRDHSGNDFHGDSSGGPLLIPHQTHFTVTASSGEGTGELDLLLPATGTTIRDMANKAPAVDFTSAETYFIDREAPGTTLAGPAFKVEGGATATVLHDDNGGTGVASAMLYLRTPPGAWAEATPTILTADTLTFTPPASGVWYYVVVGADALGNTSPAPTGTATHPAQQTLLYNAVENGAFPVHVTNGPPATYTFPMKEPGVLLSLNLPAVATAGTLTVSRAEDNSGAASAALPPAELIAQSWTIDASALPAFSGTATATFSFEESLLNGIPESQIAAAYAVEGASYTGYSGGTVAVDQGANTITVTGIAGFSEWFFGLTSAAENDWLLLE